MSVETPQKRGARTLAERTTPEWRKERARRAHLAGAVKAVRGADPAEIQAIVDAAPPLTPDQAARLRAVFAPAVQKAA